MERARFTSVLALIFFVLLSGTAGFAWEEFELEPGVHTLEIGTQHFEVETEVTIRISFEVVNEIRVAGTVTVLDSIGYGWVRLTWLEQSAVIIDEIIEGSQNFDHRSYETGHAERCRIPKFGPTKRAEPPAR